MVQKTNAALLIIALLFITGCGHKLTDYQIEIIEKAESIIASNDVSELSSLDVPPRDVYVLLGLLYIECVKLKEYKKVGSSYDKLFTTFSNLIPVYRNLVEQETNEEGYTKMIHRAIDTLDLIKKALIKEGKDSLEIIMDPQYSKMNSQVVSLLDTRRQNLKDYESKIAPDREELSSSLLRITNETHEEPIWAKNIAAGYLQEFHNLIERAEKVDE